MSDAMVTEALGESLSPSQVSTYMTCPAKWYFRYLIGLSEPTTGALALGKAFHGTLARNFRQKMSTVRDMETQELRCVCAEEWSLATADAALRDDEDADELAATGQILVAAYVKETAGPLQPHAVEQTVQGEIAGVKVRGIVDLLDTDGRVVDFKTASKRPNGLSADHRLQLTTYAMITPGANGLCRLDTVTKTKTVQGIQQSYQVCAEDRRFAETLYPMVQESIKDDGGAKAGECEAQGGSFEDIPGQVTDVTVNGSTDQVDIESHEANPGEMIPSVVPHGCPGVPQHLPSMNLNQNVQKTNLLNFYNQVKGHGPQDFKQVKQMNDIPDALDRPMAVQSPYEDYGNFNYGVVAATSGVPFTVALRGAGYAGQKAQGASTASAMKTAMGPAPYGDDPADQIQITNGYNLVTRGCYQ